MTTILRTTAHPHGRRKRLAGIASAFENRRIGRDRPGWAQKRNKKPRESDVSRGLEGKQLKSGLFNRSRPANVSFFAPPFG
jgi:hypothetical protein